MELFAAILVLFLFFLPYFIADWRKSPNKVAVCIINVLSVIFWPLWFLALIMAVWNNGDTDYKGPHL